jgi:hypothetical protein
MALHLSDLGGEAAVSEAEKSIIRRAATLTVELGRLELVFAKAGEASASELDLYQRTAGNLSALARKPWDREAGDRPDSILAALPSHEKIQIRGRGEGEMTGSRESLIKPVPDTLLRFPTSRFRESRLQVFGFQISGMSR